MHSMPLRMRSFVLTLACASHLCHGWLDGEPNLKSDLETAQQTERKAVPLTVLASLLLQENSKAAFSAPGLRVDAMPAGRSYRTPLRKPLVEGPEGTQLENIRRSLSPKAVLEVAPASYNLALGALGLGAVFGVPGSPLKNRITAFFPGALLGLFGAFLAFQTTNLRFAFDDTSFALVKSDLTSTGENVVVGGENRWAYSSFVNYDFFPSEDFPILVYFKETQTPEDQWNIGPGEQANSPEALAKGAVRGQVHFFPAIADTQYLKAAFVRHECAKLMKGF